MVSFDRPLEGSSANHKNDYHKVLKFINKLQFTFTDVDNKNSKRHKCSLCVNLKPSNSFYRS